MIQARRASEEAVVALQSAGAITLIKNKISTCYPDEICGVGKCGYRALFNVFGQTKYDAMISNLPHQDCSVLQLPKLCINMFGKDESGCIFLLRSHHWVALSLERYYDDAFCWKVVCHETALNILKCMSKSEMHQSLVSPSSHKKR